MICMKAPPLYFIASPVQDAVPCHKSALAREWHNEKLRVDRKAAARKQSLEKYYNRSTKCCNKTRGVFGGAWCHAPPLGRQDNAKLRHGLPLCNLGRKFEPRNGQNLGEDLYLFLSSANFGPKTGLILSGEILLFVFIIFKFSAPLFRKSCVRY